MVMIRFAPILLAAAALVPATSAFAQSSWGRGKGCDELRRSGTTTMVSSNSDDHGDDSSVRKFEILVSKPGHCIEARIDGVVRFSEDETMVTELERGAMASFREKTPTSDRVVRFVPADDGGMRVRMSVDGRERDFDANGRAWLAEFLPRLLREAGFDAEARVTRYRARGGTAGALREIATIESSGSRRAHYIALLNVSGLSDDEAATVVRQASEGMHSSSGDIRQLLGEVPRRLRQSPPVWQAAIAAVGRMRSDGDKRTVLQDYAATADRDLLLAVLREIPSIHSDGDKRTLLVETADNGLRSDDAALRTAWFRAYSVIRSDGDKRSVLMSALPYARSVPALTPEIIRSVDEIGSDGDASSVLVSLAGRGLLTTPGLREMYMSAARRIGSDGDRRRVIAAAEREN